ncbi:DODA-type extradiol aromatic ring-opening family dioxygenase [Sulfuriferula thiophila]|uniref:DODA-type extradiol aromatic ring-opening family dioxygenase n=1 Tax=Sulfuriferula thiophila TaxID=1781211 RepID=UPI001CB8BCFC|nr:class III extradiol ring-cleavage dioxygenase [Sulfuriferula thiophila]
MRHRMPVVFVSHGAPDALLNAPDAVDCWRELGQQVPQPTAILVVSAHWEARRPTLSLADIPETIHDFSGFPPALYRMQYRSPGAPALAERAASLLSAAGLIADLHPSRGLDHGAWAPHSVMYPHASIPVTQLSLVLNASAAAHVALGRALAPLRDEGVLIVASGAITHNFGWLDIHAQVEAAPLPQAQLFTDWVAARVAAQDVDGLLAYRSAPHGADAHPSEEHFMPFFVALGAANGDAPERFRPRFTYGALAMDAYIWRG